MVVESAARNEANLKIDATSATNAIERLARLAPIFPDAVGGFVKSMKSDELICLVGDNFAAEHEISFRIVPSQALSKFLATMKIADDARSHGSVMPSHGEQV